MSLTLTSLPEEILERILLLALEPKLPSTDTPPAIPKTSFTRSHSTPFPSSANRYFSSNNRPADFKSFSRSPVYRYTPLLACALFARIGTPLLYASIHLKSRTQCAQLVRTLQGRPGLARYIRALRIDGLWGDSKPLLRSLHVRGGRLERFDFCITDERDASHGSMPELQMFCDAVGMLPFLGTVKHLTIRKATDAYFVLPVPNCTFDYLSKLIPEWRSLETVRIGFRLPSGPRNNTGPDPAAAAAARSDMSGVQNFVAALSRAPALKVLHAELPAVWNTALLGIASNPVLHAICLSPAPPIAGAHIFLAEARKHPRLAELIEKGTPMPVPTVRISRAMSRSEPQARSGSAHGRVRAHTTVGASTPPSPRSSAFFPGSSSGSSSGLAPPDAVTSSSPSSSAPTSNTPVVRIAPPPIMRPSQRRTGRRQSQTNRRMSAV